MIILAFIVVTALCIAGVVLCRSPRHMNTACILQASAFILLCLYILVTGQMPVSSLLAGSEYFFIDHLGLFEAGISAVVFACAAIYARGYIAGLIQSGELEKSSLKLFYTAWTLLLLLIVLAFFSDNLALFWIFAELTTISSAMLVAILSARENIDAALKYVFIASVSMLFAFVGFIFLFETSRTVLGTGTLNWTELMQYASGFPPGMVLAAFTLVFIGFAAKSGIFPFHTWLPAAHAKAPSAVSAVLSGVLLNVGIYGIIRVYAIAHQTSAAATIAPLLMAFGVFTVAIAAFSMVPEKNLKKIIAFSSVENMGILLIGLAISTPLVLAWTLFHVMAHSFTKASLFFSAGILHRQYHSPFSAEAEDEIRDVFRLQPLAAWGILLGGLAIIGMPPFPSFFSEFFIMLGLGQVSLLVLAIVLVLLFIAAGGLGYFVLTNFTRVSESSPGQEIVPYRTPASMKAPIVFLIVVLLCIVILLPHTLGDYLSTIVQELKF